MIEGSLALLFGGRGRAGFPCFCCFRLAFWVCWALWVVGVALGFSFFAVFVGLWVCWAPWVVVVALGWLWSCWVCGCGAEPPARCLCWLFGLIKKLSRVHSIKSNHFIIMFCSVDRCPLNQFQSFFDWLGGSRRATTMIA